MRIQRGTLDFGRHNSLYATHGLHSFAAKCPPQLAEWAIKTLSEAGQTVLDPMAGSGTTLAEARLLGRHGLGVEIDPFSCLLSQVKSTPLDPIRLRETAATLEHNLEADFNRLERTAPPSAALLRRCQLPQAIAPEYLEYWFLPRVARDLALIKFHILNLDTDDDLRHFFLVAFSSLILAKDSVANARDIVHSRHHYREHEEAPDVWGRFRKRLAKMQSLMAEFWRQCQVAPCTDVQTRIIGHDARCLPCETDSIDLIFTSPPYCNALDYVRAHTFTVAWLSDVFDTTPADYARGARDYIGTERGVNAAAVANLREAQAGMPNVPLASRVVRKITDDHPKTGLVIEKYFADMWHVFAEMGRVLRTARHLVVVVCPSNIRKVEVPTHKVFKAMTSQLALEGGGRLRQISCAERTIDARRRLLPYMQQEFGARMQTEYVLVFRKEA